MEVLVLINIDKDFKNFFPKLDFQLRDFQKKAIQNVVEVGNTLCLMPTGGGKSIIYWMAGIECGGTTIIVSPLIALIEEQAQKIKEHGYEVLVLHGGIKVNKQVSVLTDYAMGKITPDFIFVSPEKIATDGYFEFCLDKRQDSIKLMVIDEVHCVSQWGLSFRPFYKRIPEFLDNLFGREKWCKVLGLTATINPMELKDICLTFRIDSKNILKDNILMRSEIQLHVKKFGNENEKEEYFWNLVERHKDEKILVYIYRKKGERGVEGLAQKAKNYGYKAALFHGDMTAKDRMNIIDEFKSNRINMVFSTNAFGMGIDIPDIRVVIHFMIPESAEQYYQEVGRAARDGNGANAYLLYSNKNIEVKRNYFIDDSFPSEDKLREVYKNVGKKAGFKAFQYFDNEDIKDCLPYYIGCGLIEIVAKGFSGISEAYEIKDSEIETLYKSTRTKGFVKTCSRNNITPKDFADKIYSGVLTGKVKFNKPLERWLILKINDSEIFDKQMKQMLVDINTKRQYKHELLDYFVYLIENNNESNSLHQEIARYLGMDKHQLNRIYKTADGNQVRSKSEVIICDLLYAANVNYKYEELLEYEEGEQISPDFTIYMRDGSKKFWEHIGMLGNEDYDKNWSRKLKIYNKYFPEQLIKTYESGALAKDAKNIIEGFAK